jgi:hypothetical protein
MNKESEVKAAAWLTVYQQTVAETVCESMPSQRHKRNVYVRSVTGSNVDMIREALNLTEQYWRKVYTDALIRESRDCIDNEGNLTATGRYRTQQWNGVVGRAYFKLQWALESFEKQQKSEERKNESSASRSAPKG